MDRKFFYLASLILTVVFFLISTRISIAVDPMSWEFNHQLKKQGDEKVKAKPSDNDSIPPSGGARGNALIPTISVDPSLQNPLGYLDGWNAGSGSSGSFLPLMGQATIIFPPFNPAQSSLECNQFTDDLKKICTVLPAYGDAGLDEDNYGRPPRPGFLPKPVEIKTKGTKVAGKGGRVVFGPKDIPTFVPDDSPSQHDANEMVIFFPPQTINYFASDVAEREPIVEPGEEPVEEPQASPKPPAHQRPGIKLEDPWHPPMPSPQLPPGIHMFGAPGKEISVNPEIVVYKVSRNSQNLVVDLSKGLFLGMLVAGVIHHSAAILNVFDTCLQRVTPVIMVMPDGNPMEKGPVCNIRQEGDHVVSYCTGIDKEIIATETKDGCYAMQIEDDEDDYTLCFGDKKS